MSAIYGSIWSDLFSKHTNSPDLENFYFISNLMDIAGQDIKGSLLDLAIMSWALHSAVD